MAGSFVVIKVPVMETYDTTKWVEAHKLQRDFGHLVLGFLALILWDESTTFNTKLDVS